MREIAILAGGCFWCMVKPFTSYEGVEKVVSGYIGGHKENPTYKEVCSGGTGHYEAVEITFDNEKIKFKEILDIFWKQIDPQDENGQFADRGSQYKTAIFYTSDKQKKKLKCQKRGLKTSTLMVRKLPLAYLRQATSILQKTTIRITVRLIQSTIVSTIKTLVGITLSRPSGIGITRTGII